MVEVRVKQDKRSDASCCCGGLHHPAPLVRPFLAAPLLHAIDLRPQQQQEDNVFLDVGAVPAKRIEGVANDEDEEEELRTPVRHRSLAEVATGLEEYFVKASLAGDAVSSQLEASTTEFKGKPRRDSH